LTERHRTLGQKFTRYVVYLSLLYVFVSVGAAWVLTTSWPFGSARGPRTFDAVEIETSDGVTLQGYSFATFQRPLIVLAHDYHSASGEFQGFATYLSRNGYDVLLFDFRGHGKSGSSVVSRGVFEVEDVAAVFRYIRSGRTGGLAGVAWIGVGSGAAAMTFHDEAAELSCSVLINCYDDLEGQLGRDFEDTVHTGLYPVGSLMASVVEWRLGSPLRTIRPVDELKKLEGRPVLIVQNEGDRNAAGQNIGEVLAEAAGPYAQLVIHADDPALLEGLAEDIGTRQAILDFIDDNL